MVIVYFFSIGIDQEFKYLLITLILLFIFNYLRLFYYLLKNNACMLKSPLLCLHTLFNLGGKFVDLLQARQIHKLSAIEPHTTTTMTTSSNHGISPRAVKIGDAATGSDGCF